MKKSNKSIGGAARAILNIVFICGLMAAFAFRQADTTMRVSAQTGENEVVASPESTIQIFSNPALITINDNTTASPYPSTITVSGVNPAYVTNVRVSFTGFSHSFPDDLDIMLVGPQGQRAMLMSDAGGSNPGVINITLGFDTAATAVVPDGSLTAGLFRPKNYSDAPADILPTLTPASSPDESSFLSVFNGTDPNGDWKLYIVDDAGQDTGMITGGWQLRLTVPTVFTVNSTADTTDPQGCDTTNCTLREALAIAQTGDLINFSALFNTPQIINLLTALPEINRSITIQGTGANLLTVRRDYNAPDFRIFTIATGVTNGVAISGMTIAGGRVSSGNLGGGIDSESNLTLTNVHVTGNQAGVGGGVSLTFADGVFTNCTFSNNTATNAAGSGGGIFYQGAGNRTLRVVGSTVSGNNSVNVGGGIINLSSGGNSRLEVVGSTIANNTGVNTGGILTFTQGGANSTATTTLRNTIIANNSPNNLATDTAGGGATTFETQGFNLSDNFNGVFTPNPTNDITAQPRLAPLALYGGQMPTHALLADSPAIDAGNSSGSTTDQRGRNRLFDTPGVGIPASDTSDIGAVEMQSVIVANTNGTGADSLRQKIADAPPNSDILFAAPLFNSPQIIMLGGTQLLITKNLNIIGTGANLLTVSGNNQSRVFRMDSGKTVTLSGMTITGGNPSDGNGGGGIRNEGNLTVTHSAVSGNTASLGGGIYHTSTGALTLTNSTVSGNTANTVGGSSSGGIDSGGNLTVINSTISGNRVPNGNNNGGGIWTGSNTGTATITNSTITNNSAAGGNTASGVYRSNGTVTIRNSIIAGNVNNSTQPDIIGSTDITSNGFNLIGNRGTLTIFNQPGDQSSTGTSPLNPLLTPLALNSGTTPTHALLFGSPALDAGNSSGATSDQRGLRRPVDLTGINNFPNSDGADIGAFEAQTAPLSAPTAAATVANVTISGATSYTFTVTYTDETAINVSTIGNGDVTVSGPDGFSVQPTFVSVNNIANGTPRTATYSFAPPGGTWNGGDNGTYNVSMNANQVADTDGNFVPAGDIGSFTVNIPTFISINDVSQAEGNAGTSNFNFTVSLSTAISQPVTVNFQTANGTATAGSDYTAVGSTLLTFAAGETSKQVAVSVNGDTTVEPDETFFVYLSNPTNATIDDGQGQGTIQNDDAGCSYSLNPTGNTSVLAAGISSSFNVTTGAGCNWSAASSNVQWITITSNQSGTGNGAVSYCVSANGGPQRTGTITAGGQTFTITQAAGGTTTRRMAADFDGDNRSDLSIFRPSAGQWWYQRSSNNSVGAFNFGSSTDKIVPADYDGDGKIDIATFNTSTGVWSVLRSSNLTFFAAPFGAGTDIPAPGDFDGDGLADLAVYRPSDTNWYINRTGSCAVLILQFGIGTDIPVVGDYDGDGMADIAIFRQNGAGGNAEWWIRRSTAGLFATPFGVSTDKPVQGDYTGDGKTDIAFFRPTASSPTNNWFVLRSDDITFFAAPFGLSTDTPAPGDYDGDGKYDLGVFRASDTNWFVLRSSNQTLFAQQFGATGDRPVASAFIP